MTDRDVPVTEDELHAYVDGELAADRRAAVELRLGHLQQVDFRVNAPGSQVVHCGTDGRQRTRIQRREAV